MRVFCFMYRAVPQNAVANCWPANPEYRFLENLIDGFCAIESLSTL